jgi:hypothetical protein
MTRIFAIATLAVMFGYPPVGQAMEELKVRGTVAQTTDTSKHATRFSTSIAATEVSDGTLDQ